MKNILCVLCCVALSACSTSARIQHPDAASLGPADLGHTVSVSLKDAAEISGTLAAYSQADITVLRDDGRDDGIGTRIPLSDIAQIEVHDDKAGERRTMTRIGLLVIALIALGNAFGGGSHLPPPPG